MTENNGVPAPGLTRDYTHLSQVTQIRPDQSKFAGNFTNSSHGCSDPRILEFIAAATAENTRRAYQSDLRHFLAWGGPLLPALPQQVARYLADPCRHARYRHARAATRRHQSSACREGISGPNQRGTQSAHLTWNPTQVRQATAARRAFED